MGTSPAKFKEPTVEQLPALIDETVRQLVEARDLATVRQIINRAEALKVYVKNQKGLWQTHNRLVRAAP